MEANTGLKIYDEAGNTLHTSGIQPNDTLDVAEWRGDLNSNDGNCSVPQDCDWQIDWANATIDVLFFEFFSIPGGPTIRKRYAYSASISRLYGSFWTPSNDNGSQDINFYVDAQGDISASGGGDTFESVFSGGYVIPYDLDTYCAAASGGPCNDLSKLEFFLAPVECIPGACMPQFAADTPAYTFAAEGDSRVLPIWSPTWDVEDLVLKFPQGRRLRVDGELDATDVTLTAAESDPNEWWGGVQVGVPQQGQLATGSDASAHFTDSVIENVQAQAFVSQAAVEVYDADLTLTNTRLSDSFGSEFEGSNVPSSGIYAAGPAATVTVEAESVIRDHTAAGIFLDEATLVLDFSDVFDNGMSGVYAGYGSQAYLHKGRIYDNAEYGLMAGYYTDVAFTRPDGTADIDRNTTIEGNLLGGIFADGQTSVDAGTFAKGACLSGCGNSILQSHVDPSLLDIEAANASVVTAQDDWWGRIIDDNNPDAELNLVEQSGSVIEVVPTRTAPPGGGLRPGGTRFASWEGNAGTAGRGDPARALVLEARAEAAEGDYVRAFVLLREAILTGDGDGRRLAYTEATRLLRKAQPLAVMAYLTDVAENGGAGHRPWALRALAVAHTAAEDLAAAEAAAEALVSGYGTSGHARFGRLVQLRLRLRQDELAGAVAALAAAEAAWPDHPEVEDAARLIALVSGGDGSGARGTATPPVTANAEASGRMEAFALVAYPNPAVGEMTVALTLPERTEVRVTVYDVLGREVAHLLDDVAEAGPHVATLDTSALPSGVYLVRAEAGAAAATRRITVLR